MNRSEIINLLIKKFSYKNYLEIGVRAGVNFKKIECAERHAVDPSPDPLLLKSKLNIHKMTSDNYFSKLDKNKKFDLIFIDGLHLEHQVIKDIDNSLNHLSANGTIVLHDCNPPNIHYARENEHEETPAKRGWNGTVWKAFVRARYNKNGISACVVNTDWGCGIIRFSNDKKPNIKFSLEDCLKWEVFDKNRKEILNLISKEEFLLKYINN